MADEDERVPTAQPGPEDPGVNPSAESATSDQAPSHNADVIPQSDGAAPDLVQAGPSTTSTVAPPRESSDARNFRLANDPVFMEDLRTLNRQSYDYMVAVRDGRTSDSRSLNLDSYIRPPAATAMATAAPAPAPAANGTMNGTTNGTHLNGTPLRTLNGPTPETRREVPRPTMPPGWLPPPGEVASNSGGMRRFITPGVEATGGRLPGDDAEQIEQLQRQRDRTDDDDDEDDDGEGGEA